MDSNPIVTILKTFTEHRVKFLLMGGQACILYGGSEFTRDSDLCVMCDSGNLQRVRKALKSLGAQRIFYPELTITNLKKGHACHFICKNPGLENFRVDVMSRMRNCPGFSTLWRQRENLTIEKGLLVPVMGIKHLVASKKTQRDKDWPMIRRLLERDIASCKKPVLDRVSWWLSECRTPEILIQLCRKYPETAESSKNSRQLLPIAIAGDVNRLEDALLDEEKQERHRDREFWKPLRKELERMRHEKRKPKSK